VEAAILEEQEVTTVDLMDPVVVVVPTIMEPTK
jgi:hypothetical protein